jgi:hypothetical protein
MVYYTTCGLKGIRKFRSARAAVWDWLWRRTHEANDRDGSRPFLDQHGPHGIVRVWSPYEIPPGTGPALRRALADILVRARNSGFWSGR